MVDYKYKNLFVQDHIDKQLRIATDDGLFTATNSEINWENFELTESLCSDSELRFGSCEASMVKFQIRNAFIPLTGKWLTITEALGGNTDVPFRYGHYKVFSDVPTADREYRDITAYDAMHDILGADMAAWYNALLPNKDSTVTLKQFRESFIAYFDLEEVVPEDGLVNDNMIIEKTIDIVTSVETRSETEQTSVIGETLSGMDVITAICEINGCFGHIGRDGKFHYIYLPQAIEGLYPADDLFPSNTIYPRDPKGERVGNGSYIDIKWEDFQTKSITKLQIRQEANDIGRIYPEPDIPIKPTDNCYIIQGNFLVYGKSSEQLDTIAANIFSKIIEITYTPLKSCEAMGNPCLEVGDPIRMFTKYALIETYIFERTLKGIQSLRDTYKANGTQQYTEKVNGVHQSILQLKGKSNILERTIEITRLEMKDIGNGLSNEITATAEKFAIDLQNTKAGLETNIAVTAAGLQVDIANTSAGLQSQIAANTTSITAEVTRASTAEGNLSSRITITENGLTSKVTKGNISSEISQEVGKVSIKSNRFSLDSTNTKITEDGTIETKSVKILGGVIQMDSSSGDTNYIHLSYAGNHTYIYGTGLNAPAAHLEHLYTDAISSNAKHGINLSSNLDTQSNAHIKISDGSNLQISNNAYAEFETGSSIRCGTNKVLQFTSGQLIIGDVTNYKLGFFGTYTGSERKTVSKINSTSSATASSVATTVNNLIDALKSYNLIG